MQTGLEMKEPIRLPMCLQNMADLKYQTWYDWDWGILTECWGLKKRAGRSAPMEE